MSAENVEVVRSALDALQRAFEAYWREPRSIVRAYHEGTLWPEWEEWFSHVHPEIEWRTVFLGQTFHGYEECLRVWDDFLRWATDYRVVPEAIDDLGGDQVFMVMTISGQGKESAARMDSRFYSVVTIRDGKIAVLDEHLDREDAMEAARGD